MAKNGYTMDEMKKRTGSNFYTHYNELKIRPKDYASMKNLVSERVESGYVDTVAKWRKDKNTHIDDKIMTTLLHFYTKHLIITPEFINKHDVKDYHISLIRRMYIEYDEYSDDKLGGSMGYKRPYGNSDPLGDVKEEYEAFMGPMIKFEDIPTNFYIDYDTPFSQADKEEIITEYGYDNRDEDFLLNIHNEVMDIFDKMLVELDLESLEWKSNNNGSYNWNSNWEPTEEGISKFKTLFREKKLERILNEDK